MSKLLQIVTLAFGNQGGLFFIDDVFSNRPVVFTKGFGKVVGPPVFSNKVKIFGVFREKHGFDRGKTGGTNRAGGQAPVQPGIVGRIVF